MIKPPSSSLIIDCCLELGLTLTSITAKTLLPNRILSVRILARLLLELIGQLRVYPKGTGAFNDRKMDSTSAKS